jgi:uncharacterized protein with ParB-like and HNH nuclease domain
MLPAMLTENKTAESIQQLFKSSKSIRIPAYQRAYSWEKKQCTQFLDDLVEQEGKKYYLGQFLFEKDGNTLFIIDGQQRLTTTILFLSAIAKIKIQKGENIDSIRDVYLTDVFKTIDDDQVIFKKVTQKHLVSAIDDTETISQKRIIEAFNFFVTELSELDTESLNLIQQTLENAVISTFYITNKVEATQVFEYQNNRGKELSRFEVIKAYLMHQIYIQSTDDNQANNDIAEIQSIISKTYRYIEAVEGYFTENELLDNYCYLFFNIGGNIEEIKEKLNKEENKTQKTQWIKLFFENFVELTHSAKSIVSNKNQSDIANLFLVGNEANWKIVLLTIFYKGEVTGDTFKKILKLLEVLCFKLKLGDFRTDYLPRYSKQYFDPKDAYNLDKLYQDIKNATETGFKGYWNEGDRFKNIITNYFDNEKYHYDINKIKYVLWQYENSLRLKNRSGALLDKDLYNSYTIEHIKPQNPKDEEYSEDFKKNYLHLAGNLVLLTQSQNSKFGNKSFDKKRELFQDTALSSYTEIREKTQWTETEITERHKRISDFAKQYFDTSNL